MKKLLYLCFLCICLGGCSEQTGKRNQTGLKFEELFFVIPKTIALDSLALNHYERGFSVFSDSTFFYYVAYNQKTHSIDWFDLNNDQYVFSTKLENRGPNEIIDQVTGIYTHSFDTIFLNDGVYLYVIDRRGVVKQKTPNLFETEAGMVSIISNSTSPLGYLSLKNSLIGEAIIIGNNAKDETLVTFLELNLSSGEFFLHTPDTPPCFSQDNSEKQLNAYFKGDSIIYNPGCSSEIYVYELSTMKTTRYVAKSSLSKNIVSEVRNKEPESLWKHFIENPKFFQTVFSASDNRFYRLHWKEAKYQIDSSTFSTAYDKPIILSVFDKNLKFLYEMELPENRYLVDFLIPSPGGIILNANHVQNEDYEINSMLLHQLHFK